MRLKRALGMIEDVEQVLAKMLPLLGESPELKEKLDKLADEVFQLHVDLYDAEKARKEDF